MPSGWSAMSTTVLAVRWNAPSCPSLQVLILGVNRRATAPARHQTSHAANGELKPIP